MGIKWPGFVNFEEVNLRYYVKYFDGNEWKRGVGFISEIVPQFFVAGIANWFYNEHYSTAKMDHTISISNNELQLTYNWKKKNEDWNLMWVKANTILKTLYPALKKNLFLNTTLATIN